MIVFLVFWLALLTAGMAVGFLMVIGKFVRVKRDQGELAEGVFNELDMMGNSVELMMKDFKNLAASFEILLTKVKTLEENPQEVFEQIEQLENRIGMFQETQNGLRIDVDVLLGADKEHPVLAPPLSVPSKGGRPRKEGL